MPHFVQSHASEDTGWIIITNLQYPLFIIKLLRVLTSCSHSLVFIELCYFTSSARRPRSARLQRTAWPTGKYKVDDGRLRLLWAAQLIDRDATTFFGVFACDLLVPTILIVACNKNVRRSLKRIILMLYSPRYLVNITFHGAAAKLSYFCRVLFVKF